MVLIVLVRPGFLCVMAGFKYQVSWDFIREAKIRKIPAKLFQLVAGFVRLA